MARAVRPSALKFAQTSDGDGPDARGEEDPPSFSQSNVLSPASQTQRHSRTREPPQLERAVISRTRFHITLPTPSPPPGAGKISLASERDQRGWSSPHGEPYRPLGRPELNLKFSPHLINGVSPMLHNAHRPRVIEGGVTEAVDSSEKVKEVREASSTSNTGASIVTLVDQFVTSMTSQFVGFIDANRLHKISQEVSHNTATKIRAAIHLSSYYAKPSMRVRAG
ncbi:hypothetical protein PC119_g10194 [Phytophthora cactorum]|uniref:Uncharacterized protein n=1 Tax=Phytophthora cactorum TaxID=29920 RepID=A0A8T0ZYM0_9STRA|nr:hypothetical protein PC113_g923 [Phytophthora cactorum]KAG2922809.1 hypothetical protein PC115_g9144 [Phytophthora cactorum]KAG3019708.1 hypothetical protein PC119_g10194 [Phytophthora cactorum]